MKISAFCVMAISIMLITCGCSNDLHEIDMTNDNASISQTEFKYTDSDDLPLTYNAIKGMETFQYDNGYLYFKNERVSQLDPKYMLADRTLMRYNCKTDTLTFVCNDPLCSHNTEDCPFYAMYNAKYVYNGNIYFAQLYINHAENAAHNYAGCFKGYNLTTGESMVRNTIDSDGYSEYANLLVADNYVFYYDSVYQEELDDWVFAVCRWDTNNNTIAVVSGNDNAYDPNSLYPDALSCRFLFALDSRIYFTNGKTIYSTDMNMEDRKEHISGQFLLDVFTDGEYIYYGLPQSEGSNIQSLHRVDFSGKNDIDLGIISEKGNAKITSNYIYYQKYDEIAIGKANIRGYASDTVTLYNSEIWRCDHDGKNQTLVYKFDGDMANYRIFNESYIGNYIYGLYQWWEDADNDGVFEDGDNYSSATKDEYNIMRIDITTGDIYIINGIK